MATKSNNNVGQSFTVDDLIKSLSRIAPKWRKLPVVIDCPNGLEVKPAIKFRWNDPMQMMQTDPDKMVITWQD